MTRDKFINKLDRALISVPYEERKDIIQDFEEHFAMGENEGKSEEEIAESLGAPNQIAKEVLASYYLGKVEKSSSTGNVMRAVWAVIGLGFFNLVIVLAPFVAIAGFVLSGWIAGGAFIVSPLLFIINILLFPDSFNLIDMFASIALSGAGILLIIGMYYLTKLIRTVFIRYLNYNVRLVKGGMKA
ncbi:Uncharacterized membrane protein [Gracilibacillus ureilyticus]|uniref:Uncharacterized membrane protein n=1 Tax=Gracilibacillus ureilyticus TaxID=531814 RepID=A0A1H9Q9Y4_9BACI|nr:DUF1700 domain-containing protein [Gracilibacillus ureilyticus]SER56653.1 Uncharacterized membrane protein [Gracilibacillus ureilyticus]